MHSMDTGFWPGGANSVGQDIEESITENETATAIVHQMPLVPAVYPGSIKVNLTGGGFAKTESHRSHLRPTM